MPTGTVSADLSRLFRPRSVAVIGGGWGVAVVEQCRKMGFAGPVWAVHPSRAEIGGVATVPRIEDLPEAPDAVFIGINRHATVEAVAALAGRGAGGAVCFASGFAEAEDGREAGAALQADLVAAAGDMPVLGPNCYGLINYLDGALLWPDQHGGRRVEQGVAIFGQSSNMLLNMTMQQRALPLAFVAAAGNQAQIGLADMALAAIGDDRVSAIGLHIEGIGDIRAFEAMAAAARAAGKPVVALKVGRSDQAQAAAVSHTASLAGSDAGGRAFLARLGIPVLRSLPEFMETLKLLHVHGPLPGRRLGSMSCSGGEAALVADAGEGRVDFPPLAEADRARIKATLSDLVTVANPLDYHTFIWNDEARLTATYRAFLETGHDLDLLVMDFPRKDRCDAATWEPSVRAIVAAAQETGARVAVVATLPEALPEVRAEALMTQGLAPMLGLEETMAAVEAAAAIHARWQVPAPLPVLTGGEGEGVPMLIDEDTAKAELGAVGVPVPAGSRAADAESAATLAGMFGFPVALKSLGHAHKTEAGAVRLNLQTADAVREEAGWLGGGPYLVECMVQGGVAELLVGIVRDPIYGFTLTLGAGGVMSELLADTVTLLVPATREETAAALDDLKVAALLRGHRGKPGADPRHVVDVVETLQAFAHQKAGTLHEVEINPLIVTPQGAVAADALVRISASDPDGCC